MHNVLRAYTRPTVGQTAATTRARGKNINRVAISRSTAFGVILFLFFFFFHRTQTERIIIIIILQSTVYFGNVKRPTTLARHLFSRDAMAFFNIISSRRDTGMNFGYAAQCLRDERERDEAAAHWSS